MIILDSVDVGRLLFNTSNDLLLTFPGHVVKVTVLHKEHFVGHEMLTNLNSKTVST